MSKSPSGRRDCSRTSRSILPARAGTLLPRRGLNVLFTGHLRIGSNCCNGLCSFSEGTMYTSILIPTDGSELAGKAIQHGIALAKQIRARITALTVLPPFHTFTTDAQMI